MKYFFFSNFLFFFSADNGSTLSSEAITDSATSTDNNYGYMGTDTHTLTLVQEFVVCLCSLMCVCSLGQEPFKRRPVFSHTHHTAVCVGDSLCQISQIISVILHQSTQRHES